MSPILTYLDICKCVSRLIVVALTKSFKLIILPLSGRNKINLMFPQGDALCSVISGFQPDYRIMPGNGIDPYGRLDKFLGVIVFISHSILI